jgi:hypothetical protein
MSHSRQSIGKDNLHTAGTGLRAFTIIDVRSRAVLQWRQFNTELLSLRGCFPGSATVRSAFQLALKFLAKLKLKLDARCFLYIR